MFPRGLTVYGLFSRLTPNLFLHRGWKRSKTGNVV